MKHGRKSADQGQTLEEGCRDDMKTVGDPPPPLGGSDHRPAQEYKGRGGCQRGT